MGNNMNRRAWEIIQSSLIITLVLYVLFILRDYTFYGEINLNIFQSRHWPAKILIIVMGIIFFILADSRMSQNKGEE